MDKEIRQYMREIDAQIERGKPEKGTWKDLEAELLTRIGFFQHERLVHLIVTMTVAVATILMFLSLFLTKTPTTGQLLLTLLLLGLLAPYLGYYYLLENAVQKIYGHYLKIREFTREIQVKLPTSEL